jgi:hypothetical protein
MFGKGPGRSRTNVFMLIIARLSFSITSSPTEHSRKCNLHTYIFSCKSSLLCPQLDVVCIALLSCF